MLQIRLSESMLAHPSVGGLLKNSSVENLKAPSLEFSLINEYIEVLKRAVKGKDTSHSSIPCER
jgi:hypothetical protein